MSYVTPLQVRQLLSCGVVDSSPLLACYELRSFGEDKVSAFAFLFVSGPVREIIDFFTWDGRRRREGVDWGCDTREPGDEGDWARRGTGKKGNWIGGERCMEGSERGEEQGRRGRTGIEKGGKTSHRCAAASRGTWYLDPTI